MLDFGGALDSVRTFMEAGGPVLNLIFGVITVMLALVLERALYFQTAYKREASRVIEAWEARSERKSWHAHKIRTAMISQVKEGLNQNIGLIKTLVAICPLCGLLGTVTGIHIADEVIVDGKIDVTSYQPLALSLIHI